MTTQRRWSEAVERLEAGAASAEVSRELGVDPRLLEQVALAVGVLEHRAARRRLRLLAGGAAAVLVAGSMAALPVLAQPTCSQTLPSPLVTLCPNTPALAGDVNGNFQQLVSWVEQKVGGVGSANVSTPGSLTAGSVTTAGTVTATGTVTGGALATTGTLTTNRIVVSGGVIQSPGAIITSTGDLGLYQRATGAWMRFVNNNAPFRFYANNGPTGIGVDNVFNIETNGNLTTTYGEGEGTNLLPQSFCVIVPRNAGCPGNWDQREIKWDTEDSSNADQGKDGVIASDDGNSGSVKMRFCCRGW